MSGRGRLRTSSVAGLLKTRIFNQERNPQRSKEKEVVSLSQMTGLLSLQVPALQAMLTHNVLWKK